MDDNIKKRLHEMYDDVKNELNDATLFGESIDTDDPKIVAVAFYYWAKQNEYEKKRVESNKRMENLFRIHKEIRKDRMLRGW